MLLEFELDANLCSFRHIFLPRVAATVSTVDAERVEVVHPGDVKIVNLVCMIWRIHVAPAAHYAPGLEPAVGIGVL